MPNEDDSHNSTLWIRPAQGGVIAPDDPDAVYERLTLEMIRRGGFPICMCHGTKRGLLRGVMRVGLRCKAEHTGGSGRAYIHCCPCPPGDPRITSGIRDESTHAIFMGPERLLHNGRTIFRSSNDVCIGGCKNDNKKLFLPSTSAGS